MLKRLTRDEALAFAKLLFEEESRLQPYFERMAKTGITFTTGEYCEKVLDSLVMEANEEEAEGRMDFSEALLLLKQGKKMRRKSQGVFECVFMEDNHLYIGDTADECYTENPTEYTLQEWLSATDWEEANRI